MIIKWTDEMNSFDKHKFIHKEKQRGYHLLHQAEDNLFVSFYDSTTYATLSKIKTSTNLLVGLFGNKIEKLFVYYV